MIAAHPPTPEARRPADARLDRAHTRLVRGLVAAVVVVNAFVTAVVAVNLRRSYLQRQEKAALSAQSTARLLELSIDAVLDRVEDVLRTVVDELDRQRGERRRNLDRLEAEMIRQASRASDLLTIRYADADGMVRRGVPTVEAPYSVADRDFFAAQREGRGVGLFIGRPATGRTTKVPRVALSRRVERADGSFDGVVFGTISLEHFAAILAEVEVGPRGAALLRFEDLSAVVRRSSGVVEPFLEPSDPSPALRRQVAGGSTAGTYTSVAPKDGIRRTYGWRKVGDAPFYVLVGLAQDDLLAGWWTEVLQAAALVALFAAATGLGAGWGVRSLRRQRAAAEALRATEARLQQAQRLETVGRLAGGVAHDFNNMLSVILGEAEMLQAELPSGHPGLESVRQIALAGERSRELTKQLLAFSRKQAISPRAVSLNSLVEATRPALARLIGEDVTLAFAPAPDLRPVRLDPGQFDQVLVNLVVNARDAMPGGGRISLATANVTLPARRPAGLEALPAGDYALLTVQDDGHGMDSVTLAHLFEPFFTTKGEGRGTGLGLATTYGIVRQNGGTILVASAPGQGTTFSIYLPCVAGPSHPVQDAPAPSAPARGQGTILLAEDEAPVRRTTRKLLESLGYRVIEAASGEEALAAARADGIDLLVTDVVLPGMKGPEIAQRVQELQPGVPALFISGHTANVLGKQGVLAPGVHFLQKPFGVEDLARKLEEALRYPTSSRAPSASR